jgi:hypothetical protein
LFSGYLFYRSLEIWGSTTEIPEDPFLSISKGQEPINAAQKEELVRLTRECGGEWGINHTQLCLEKSRRIADQRIQEMEHVLQQFEEDSFGCF